MHPIDYAAQALKGVIAKVPYIQEHPEEIGDVITGCAMAINELNLNAGRLIVNRAELPDDVPAQTINRFCSSGLQAIAPTRRQRYHRWPVQDRHRRRR